MPRIPRATTGPGWPTPTFPAWPATSVRRPPRFPHVHFNGAGGNIGAGKWNDGSPREPPDPGRPGRRGHGEGVGGHREDADHGGRHGVGVGTGRLAARSAPRRRKLEAVVNDASKPVRERAVAATELVWLRRCLAGDTIDVACLHLGKARVLHLPGELFVEYQLAAQKLRPDLFVAMAAYGDYAPGYIGTEIAYPQGGYETGPQASHVAPASSESLMDVIRRLLTPSTAAR